MDSKKVLNLRKKYPSKKRLAAQVRASKRWSKTVGSQQESGEPSDPQSHRQQDAAFQSGSASVVPGEGSLASHRSSSPVGELDQLTPAFQSGSATAVSSPSPIGEIDRLDMASTGSAPEEVSLAAHQLSPAQGGTSNLLVSSSLVCTPVPAESSTPISVSFQQDLSSSCENSPATSVLSSVYVPTPIKREVLKKVGFVSSRPVEIPEKLYMGQARQVLQLVEHINDCCKCATVGCSGRLIPNRFKCQGLGGAINIFFVCNGCRVQTVSFNSSLNFAETRRTVVGFALQIAFLISGKTYADYHRTVKMCLGMSGVSPNTFYSTIKVIYPHVHDMIEEQCQEALYEMKGLSNGELGSFARAVTTADGVWHQRKFSKNHTFTVRNYLNNSLLYFVHLCMRGKDNLLPDELYKGTSKAAEGHAAEIAFRTASTDGLHIEVHWQDGDSTSAAAFREYYPDEQRSRVMLCGGHVARSFVNRLSETQKIKSFSPEYISRHKAQFPKVEDVKCCCLRGHKKGCGCITPAFLTQARINFFSCLVQSKKNAEAFSNGMKNLGKYHARDIHEWDGGKCSFHEQRVCDCNNCEDELLCEGKPYHTRNALTCELHALAFEIECYKRAEQAKDLIHHELGRGHSNLPEASHSVLIRFRTKDVYLYRLHYITSTNLGLLQANLSYMYHKRGPGYHWIADLFQRLKLPAYSGMEELLKNENEKRMANLQKQKLTESKANRVGYKIKRAIELENRKQWVQQQKVHHGYGLGEEDSESDSGESTQHLKSLSSAELKAVVVCNTGKMCKCGSSSHTRTSHRDCPLNKVGKAQSDSCDSEDDLSEGDFPLSESGSDSDVDNVCTCGVFDGPPRAHCHTCPMNPSFVCDPQFSAIPEIVVSGVKASINEDITCKEEVRVVSAADCDRPVSKITSDRIRKRVCRSLFSTKGGNSASTNSGTKSPSNTVKRKNEDSKNEVPPKRQKTIEFDVGNYACVHSSRFAQHHLLCRIAEIVDGCCRLCCGSGVLNTCFSHKELTPLSGSHQISLSCWRLAPKISLSDAASEPANLEKCECVIVKPTIVDLDDRNSISAAADNVWVNNMLYKLTLLDKQVVVAHNGWLHDSVITAAQSLMLQQSPRMQGLQPPTLAQKLLFEVHQTEPFVQILNVRNNHWCVVSNVECDKGVVNVYDSLYSSLSTSTVRVIASLVFCPNPTLTIRMMDVDSQINLADCGVLAIANAYEICCGRDPCRLKFDHKSIRQHLATCLEKCMLTPFPEVGERSYENKVKSTRSVNIYCECRLPEDKNLPMAQCDSCNRWFHKHCLDIPDNVFEAESGPWVCIECKRI